MRRNRSSRPYRRKEWEEWLEAAAEYKSEYGNLLVPSAYETPDGYKLGRWIERQRAMYNGVIVSTLNDPKIAALNAIGMVWKLEYRSPWDYWMEQVKIYFDEHGNLLIPKDYENGYFRLGYWIAEQRKKHAKGLLTEAQIKDLEAYGMSWSEGERRAWDEWYADALSYYRSCGDLLVPIAYETAEGRKLGTWIAIQRERYAGTHNRCSLPNDQIEKLDAIGMVWNLQEVRDDKWESMYKHIAIYVSENGRLPLWPRNIMTSDGRNMTYWVSVQRTRLSEGKCPPDQTEKLKKVGIYAWKEAPVADMSAKT